MGELLYRNNNNSKSSELCLCVKLDFRGYPPAVNVSLAADQRPKRWWYPTLRPPLVVRACFSNSVCVLERYACVYNTCMVLRTERGQCAQALRFYPYFYGDITFNFVQIYHFSASKGDETNISYRDMLTSYQIEYKFE